MAGPSFTDPAETRFAHVRTDLGAFDKIVDLNERLRFVPEGAADTLGNIFIIGLQRSGTTLAYQLAAGCTDAGYINNLIARFWENPAYGVYLFRHLGLRKNISFESVHGTTEDISDVHEFGYFWASLLGTKSNAALAEINPAAVDWQLIRHKLLSINAAFDKPCIHKNTLIGHFVPQLAPLLHKQLFLYIKRDLLQIASSILKVRQKRYGDQAHWWSLKPYEFERIKGLCPHEQVAAQIYYLERDLEKRVRALSPESLWEIEYRDVCADPESFLQQLTLRASKAGIRLERTGATPQPFGCRAPSQTDDDVRLLARYLDQYHLPYERTPVPAEAA